MGAGIRSYCKLGLGRLTCGAALDVKLLPALARGENGANALVALMDAFVALGGFFVQIDIMDADALRAARENPQAYKSLSVRVSGWNARFVTLNEEWQNMVIERTARATPQKMWLSVPAQNPARYCICPIICWRKMERYAFIRPSPCTCPPPVLPRRCPPR